MMKRWLFLLVPLCLFVATKSWAPPIGPGGIYGGGGATTMSELTDTAGAATNQVMKWDGSIWAPAADAGAASGGDFQSDGSVPMTGAIQLDGNDVGEAAALGGVFYLTTLEVGHASDSTIARSGAGVLTLEGVTIGDVTGVGDCAVGACLDGTSDGGETIALYDGDSHKATFDVPDISGDVVYTFPAATATIIPDTGSANIVTVGTIATGTWEGTTVAVDQGGTGATTLTDGGILLGSGAGAITALGAAANGQIPIGDGATDPVLATITAVANETDVTNGAGSITIGIVASPTLDATNITGIVDGALPATATFNAVTGTTVTVGTSLVISGDTINDFAGTGLSVSSNVLTAATASLTVLGMAEYATTTETIAGTDATRAVTPDGLTDALANAGVVDWTSDQGATNIHSGNYPITDDLLPASMTANAHAITTLTVGTSIIISGDTINDFAGTGLSVSSNVLIAATADSTTLGLIETATVEETNTGTALDRAVTPDGLDGFTGSAQIVTVGAIGTGTWASTDIPVANGGTGSSTAVAARAALEAPPPMNSATLAGSSVTVDDYGLGKQSVGITITAIHCITDTGTADIDLVEGSATAWTGDDVMDSPIQCDSNGATAVTISNGTIHAADWLGLNITAKASTPTVLSISWYYTVD